ncbi:hypothetical protein Btru_025235 [Bulinus truncatus]|nr:hypothetical protein Btru_025235 [Bulinus truncatus]
MMDNETREATTESSVNFTVFPDVGKPQEARSRYLWIGLFGITLNGIAILYLAFSRKVKPTLRVTMIGLSMNDLIFNADLAMLGYPNWSLVSQTSECWTITLIMIASVVVSYLITIQLSLHNYLAVFHPFHSNVVPSVFRCTTAVVASYVLGYLLAFACLGLSFEPRLPCYVLAVVPRSGLAIACGACLSCSLVVIAVNLKVCLKIRRRKMVVHSDVSARHARLCHVFDIHSSFKRHPPLERSASRNNNRGKIPDDRSDFAHQDMGDQSTSDVTLNLTVIAPCRSRCVGDKINNELGYSVYQEHPINPESKNAHKEHPITHKLLKNAIKEQPSSSTNCKDLFQKILANQNQPVLIHNNPTSPCLIPANDSVTCTQQTAIVGTMDVIPVLNKEDNPDVFSKHDRVMETKASQIKHGGVRPRSGTSNTLAILTWCSCLLTFPLIVEMIYGTIWVNDRLQFLTNWFGMLVSSLLTAHGLSNPLLYAWRRIVKNALTSVPDFSTFETKSVSLGQTMYEIDLSANKIKGINSGQFSTVKTYILRLENNMLTRIEDKAFHGAAMKRLICRNNYYLSHLGDLAFSGIKDFHFLDLSKSRISNLPTEGLIDIRELVIEDTPTLKQFPSVFKFSEINTARLTYKHHCCAFRHPYLQDPEKSSQNDLNGRASACTAQMTTPSSTTTSDTLTTTSTSLGVFRLKRDGYLLSSIRSLISLGWVDHWGAIGDSKETADTGGGNKAKGKEGNEHGAGANENSGHMFLDFGVIVTSSTSVPVGLTTRGSAEWHESFSTHDTRWFSCGNFTKPKDYSEVVCTPQPNAFNPCEDLMGYEWLRVFVWFVLLAALGGNLVVIVVLLTARSKLTVPKFLMCNLSFADFLMGLYLLLIASVDVHFLGDYFTHAVSWQNDGGCQVAGFITVFASELSVFVLTVITLERWYAISQAIHVNKRLRMRQATCLMFVGWGYASSMAVLPILGVSGYGAVSICLPMEARDLWDVVYITGLLLFNGAAFTTICGCYISMFLKVRASENMERRNDVTIAKRMAILVLTNFICWAPIAFFGLTASFGLPLIDITNSKVLLVFFYPFNSCANPFLYAILTKQFRKDFFILLGRYGICTDRANRYKGTSTTRSYSNSRNNGMMLNVTHNNPTDTSILSQYRTGSRGSFSQNGTPPPGSRGSFPKVTPQSTPQETPTTSPKVVSSPCKDGLGRMFSFSTSIDSSKGSKSERKLSTVIETSHTSDGPSDDGCGACSAVSCNGDRVLEARDSLRDLFDGNPHGRVRSASEYIVIFKASPQSHQQQGYMQQHPSLADRRRSSQRSENLERQMSKDTLRNSSNTLSSYFSDGSSRFDSDSDVRLFDRRQSPASFITMASMDKRDSGISDMYPVLAGNYMNRNRKSQDSGNVAETEALLNKRNNLSGMKKNGPFDSNEHKNKYSLMDNRFSADSIDEEDGYVQIEVKKRMDRQTLGKTHLCDDGGAYSTDGDDADDEVAIKKRFATTGLEGYVAVAVVCDVSGDVAVGVVCDVSGDVAVGVVCDVSGDVAVVCDSKFKCDSMHTNLCNVNPQGEMSPKQEKKTKQSFHEIFIGIHTNYKVINISI